MATDVFGNYLVGLSETTPTSTSKLGQVMFGTGAPTGTPLAYQTEYVDTATGHIYCNVNGAWVLKV